MSITPIISIINERLILPKIGTKESIKRPMDHIAKSQNVILVGFGHFGSTVGRFLRSHGIEATILYDAYELLNMGMENIYRESLDTSLSLAKDVLSKLGFRKYTLNQQVQNFIKYDESSLRRLAAEPVQDDNYIFKARKELEEQERLLNEDFKRGIVEYDNHWDSESIRKVLEDQQKDIHS